MLPGEKNFSDCLFCFDFENLNLEMYEKKDRKLSVKLCFNESMLMKTKDDLWVNFTQDLIFFKFKK